MLKILREHKRSIFGTVIIGLCSLLMIPFGTDMIQRSQGSSVAVAVGNEELSVQDYQQNLNRWQNIFRQQLGENYHRMQAMLNLEQRAIDDLINGVLLERIAESFGLSASLGQIQERISSHPYFAGNVTRSAYQAFLQVQGISGAALEESTKNEIVADQLQAVLSDLNVPARDELKTIYRDENRKASFRYIAVSPQRYADKVVVEEQELEDFYAENLDNYRKPRAVRFAYASFPASEYRSQVEVTENDLRDRYELTGHEYFEPAEVHLRRILFKKASDHGSALAELVGVDSTQEDSQSTADENELIRQKAEDVVARLEDGEEFAALAAEVSEDKESKAEGGDLGWIRYPVLESAVRRVVSDLDPGAFSAVLETAEGFQVVYVEDKKERRQLEFEEVRDKLEEEIRNEDAPTYAQVAADNLLQALETNPDGALETVARERSIPVTRTEQFVSREEPLAELPQGMFQRVIEMNQGEQTLLNLDDTTYLVEILEERASFIPELADVRDEVIEDFKQVRAAELAEKHASELLEEAKAKLAEDSTDGSLAAVAEENGLALETTNLTTRATASAPVFTAPEALQTAYTLTPERPLADKVFSLGTSHYLIELAEVETPDESQFEQQYEELRNRERTRGGARLANALIERLRTEVDVWVNPDLIAPGAQF